MKYLVLDVGGTAIKHALMIEKLEKKIILIPSEIFMFDCTIKENIVLNTDNKCDINKLY